jgi:undecaprenyl-diphosphatase
MADREQPPNAPAEGPARPRLELTLTRSATTPTARRRLTAGLVVLTVAGVAIGLPLHVRSPIAWEIAMLASIADARTTVLTAVLSTASFLGDLLVSAVLCLLVIAVVRVRSGRWNGAALIALAFVGSLTVTAAVKVAVGRVRPTGATVEAWSAAFPSGHSSRAAALLGLALWATLRFLDHPAARAVVSVLLGAGMVLVAGARVYVGIHWPSDVLFGLALGLTWVAVVLWAIEPRVSPSGGGQPRGTPRRG